jgi:predicted lipoprotein with Yx(FWY)xxD motif
VRHPSVLVMATLALASAAIAGCGSSSGTSEGSGHSTSATTSASTAGTPNGSAGGTIIGTEHTSLGTILVAGPKHLTVYLWEADKGSTSTCSGACAQVWPPVTTTGAPKAEGEAVAANLGTTTRPDGTKQVTYKGHPLYWYVSDTQAGETTGQGSTGFGAAWYVMSPDGSKITNS